jgi:hypothetical protein
VFFNRSKQGERPVLDRLYTTTIRLRYEHAAWLSQTSIEIRQRTGAHVNKSALIRALIDGLASAHVDLSRCCSEAEIKQMVASKITVQCDSTSSRKGRRLKCLTPDPEDSEVL